MNTLTYLIHARNRYADSPSHEPDCFKTPEEGTYCIITACDQDGWAVSNTLIDLLHKEVEDHLVDFNAEHSTEEVVELFDRVIEKLEASLYEAILEES